MNKPYHLKPQPSTQLAHKSKSANKMKGAIISVIALIAIMATAEAALDCGKVDSFLVPCVPYLTAGGTPTPKCCQGVQSIKDISVTPQDKRDSCNCLKAAAQRYPTLKDEVAQALPAMCKVTLDIPISRTTNCEA